MLSAEHRRRRGWAGRRVVCPPPPSYTLPEESGGGAAANRWAGLKCDQSGWEMKMFPSFGNDCRHRGRFGDRQIEMRYIWGAWGSTPMSNLLYQKAFFAINRAFIRGAPRCPAPPYQLFHRVRDRLMSVQLETGQQILWPGKMELPYTYALCLQEHFMTLQPVWLLIKEWNW